MPSLSISKQLTSAQSAIYNAMELPGVQEKLNKYSFNARRMQEGNALLAQATLLHNAMQDSYGEKQEVSSQLNAQEKETRQLFRKHVDTVRLAFREDEATLAKFRIDRIASRKDAWQLQASYFYTKAILHADVLAGYQLSQEELAQNQASVEALIAIRNRRLQKKGEAEEATQQRNKVMKELNAWMKEFRTIARLALKDSPQLLEALGMKVPSKV
ncbi:hypothetical protein WJR50_04460 [Catalinimonas sp. 4WD22]|uniref:hypothetical protein n=1 Tax=Catalinimonas locisalis TaxID=3133978 RepID=UPI003100B892